MSNKIKREYEISETKEKIVFGRKNATIQLKSSRVSKVQMTVYVLSKCNKLLVMDGDGTKPSRNGCWVVMNNEKYTIKDGDVFKVCGKGFECRVVK